MEEEKIVKLEDALKELVERKVYLWDISKSSFVSFIFRSEAGAYEMRVIPESELPPITKSDMIKRLKSSIEKEISIKYLGEETYNMLSSEQKEYETFFALYGNGMRRINNPLTDDEKYYNRLYDRYYKRLLREKKKSETKDKEVIPCPYTFIHNGKKHKAGQVCGAPGKACYGGFCSKHKASPASPPAGQ